MHRSMMFALILLLASPSAASAATIYRCTGPTGATVFSQVPCGKDAEVTGSHQSAPAPDPADDKAVLAGIDARCKTESRKIIDGYGVKFAEANSTIAGLHDHLMIPGEGGTRKDPAVVEQIANIEARKTDMLGAQDRELAVLHSRCQAERDAELRRQADRNAVVKR
ncbi:MAG TPA: DUF4124 domain-containing protein [Rhodanobacteraceae bacterium]|nr:DUF4124 domain-containing protein [Rhodanobacteraceae bacterium]